MAEMEDAESQKDGFVRGEPCSEGVARAEREGGRTLMGLPW